MDLTVEVHGKHCGRLMDKSDHWISLKDAANTVTLCQRCDAIAFNWVSKGCAPLGNEHPDFLISFVGKLEFFVALQACVDAGGTVDVAISRYFYLDIAKERI